MMSTLQTNIRSHAYKSPHNFFTGILCCHAHRPLKAIDEKQMTRGYQPERVSSEHKLKDPDSLHKTTREDSVT